MFTVYILRSTVAKKSYVGLTTDIDRRIGEHNAGRHAYTKRYVPWKLKYSEQVSTLEEARRLEKYFKSATGRRFLKGNIFS